MSSLSWAATFLGLVATIMGTGLAYFTFVSPMYRVRLYLRKAKMWEEVFTDFRGIESYWRYKRHPEFVLERGASEEWDPQVVEAWMPHCPDSQKSRTMIHARVGGQILIAEEFIAMDGGRYFVPLPRRKFVDGAPEYWYTPLQVGLARVVGTYYRIKTVEDFISNQQIPVKKP